MVPSNGIFWASWSPPDSKRARLRRFAIVVLGVAPLLLVSVGAGFATPSVAGRVTILDIQGKPKEHHDGVVVFLDALEHAPPASPPTESQAIRQINKQFIPEVLPVLVGTTVEFPNNDIVYHNVFSLFKAKPFDLGIYEQGGSKSVTFDQSGLVKVYCNIHSQMVAYVLVLENPYFTITDREGRFMIPDVPEGAATVRTWYPRSKQHAERAVRATAQGLRDVDLKVVEQVHFEIREDVLSIEHKNKWGQSYPAKY